MREGVASSVKGDYIKVLAAIIHIHSVVHCDCGAFSAPSASKPTRHDRFGIHYATTNTFYSARYTVR